MLRNNNTQLTELHFYINEIARCINISVILSARRQDHKFNTIINFSTFLQFSYIQINQQASCLHRTLLAQPNLYSSPRLPPQTHFPALPPTMKPEHLLLKTHIMQHKMNLTIQSQTSYPNHIISSNNLVLTSRYL